MVCVFKLSQPTSDDVLPLASLYLLNLLNSPTKNWIFKCPVLWRGSISPKLPCCYCRGHLNLVLSTHFRQSTATCNIKLLGFQCHNLAKIVFTANSTGKIIVINKTKIKQLPNNILRKNSWKWIKHISMWAKPIQAKIQKNKPVTIDLASFSWIWQQS